MGRVTRQLKFDNKEDMKIFLEDEFDYLIDLTKDVFEYENQQLDDILVNLKIECENEEVYLTISKLVSLKAFLLSKEQNMNIIDLVYKIDKVMNMSNHGLKKSRTGICYDNNLKEFLHKANIKVEELEKDIIKLTDAKRSVCLKHKNQCLDFNTINLIEEF